MKNNKEIITKFYYEHPQAENRIHEWFDLWSHVNTIIQEWDDECITNEYDELCDWFDGEENLLNWVKEQ